MTGKGSVLVYRIPRAGREDRTSFWNFVDHDAGGL